MRRVPLRLRLAGAFAVAMAVALTAAGLFVYARVGSDLNRALDQDLRGRAQDLSALVRGGGSLDATRGSLLEGGESFAELIGPGGIVLDATEPIGSTRLLTPRELARARLAATFADRPSVPGLDEPARLLAVTVDRSRELVLVVGATRENRSETLHSLRTAFLIGGALALVVASVAGYFLAGVALRPIEAMRRRAAEISASSIDERLPVAPTRDEVARLGETLNAMLDRIEDGLERERRFVADASHELRTPLALLKTELELALRHERSPDELEQAIRSAAGETDRLARIANDLLLLARSDRGGLPLDVSAIDTGSLLHSTAERFEGQAVAQGRRLAVCAEQPAVVTGDRLRLEQALGNLVDNALRYGAGPVTLEAVRTAGAVELHVTDEGGGISADFLERAFDRFSRADDARGGEGSGLGLAIVETIARAHGGQACAANRSDGGADVWILLPETAIGVGALEDDEPPRSRPGDGS